MAIFKPWVRRLKRFSHLIYSRFTVAGALPQDEAVVFVVHHQNMFGPIHTMMWLPQELRMWVLHVFLDRKSCFAQYYNYTFTVRFHWPRPWAWLVSRLCSLVVPSLLRGMGAIPVYRGVKEIIRTMELSLQALLQGESLVISPDVHYDDPSPVMGEIQPAFLHLEKQYFRQTGRHLAFIPVYCSAKCRQIVLGAPLRFTGQRSFKQEQLELLAALQSAVNALGRQCGDIE